MCSKVFGDGFRRRVAIRCPANQPAVAPTINSDLHLPNQRPRRLRHRLRLRNTSDCRVRRGIPDRSGKCQIQNRRRRTPGWDIARILSFRPLPQPNGSSRFRIPARNECNEPASKSRAVETGHPLPMGADSYEQHTACIGDFNSPVISKRRVAGQFAPDDEFVDRLGAFVHDMSWVRRSAYPVLVVCDDNETSLPCVGLHGIEELARTLNQALSARLMQSVQDQAGVRPRLKSAHI